MLLLLFILLAFNLWANNIKNCLICIIHTKKNRRDERLIKRHDAIGGRKYHWKKHKIYSSSKKAKQIEAITNTRQRKFLVTLPRRIFPPPFFCNVNYWMFEEKNKVHNWLGWRGKCWHLFKLFFKSAARVYRGPTHQKEIIIETKEPTKIH